ncbi:type II toxin-antitoxin system mRNA interferase RelE [Janibacter melonis]|uniref:type II toxin-antitoxin system RelE family toxin n=1 Tax=Janibacter melonis TaxID=262209 RepID=UPI001E61BFA9|nr:type II toxin-antitoxin system RelE/ParE family toxin [Janibacter melonis]MCB5993226.1 type II toxin-antitoxin system RelE/ParE family toxin [Janibacter melonis]
MSSPPWDVQFSRSAERALGRLPEKIAVAVLEFVTGTLPINPHRLSKPLHEPFDGWRSARRGDYRVVFEIKDDDHVLHVGRIEHRADVYRGGPLS